MLKGKSYFNERLYEESELHEWNCEKSNYWSCLLGQESYEKLLRYSKPFKHYLRDGSFWENECENMELFQYLNHENDKEQKVSFGLDVLIEMTFGTFYQCIVGYAVEKLHTNLCEHKQYFVETIYQDFLHSCAKRLQTVCVRTLTIRMHEYKERGRLQGKSPREEYEYFCFQIIGKKEFVKETFQLFPALYRIVEEIVEFMVQCYTEVIVNFEADYNEIQEVFEAEVIEQKISHITGNFSDVHNKGHQVLKIQLESGMEIFYKPRSMDNEKIYNELLQWISKRTNITQYSYRFLSKKNYSWSAAIYYKECSTVGQLREYYKRLGAQIFLAYLLGTKDLHFENLIASGEYPVLVDLETLVNIKYNHKRETAKEEILYQLSQSVLYSGILPCYHWSQNGIGINSSAISGTKDQIYPFKIPVIVNDKTSNMQILYRYPVTQQKDNLATVKGEFYEPSQYIQEIIEGFTRAYRAVSNEKEKFGLLLKRLQPLVCRYLVADTQRYSMLLNSSYHPSLLKDGVEREIFLHAMWQGRKEEEKEIVEAEVRDLLYGDIPLFYYRLDGTALYTSTGKAILNYFEKSATDILSVKLASLNEDDLERQCSFISLSLEMLSKDIYTNRIYYVDGMKKFENFSINKLKKDIEYLIQRILKFAVWNGTHTEVSWYTIQFRTNRSSIWELSAMNMYLYDGLAGMLVIFSILKEKEHNKNVEEIFITLEKMLFHYTENGMEDLSKLESKRTGAYDGEGSILYAYMILYQMSGDIHYLNYAKKHAKIMEQLLEMDKTYDLISGNAGAAYVLLILYEITKDRQFLIIAEKAVECLEKTAILQKEGIGWVIDSETLPMSGMAHGNSGFLMSVIKLWKLTKDKKYEELAEQIWKYEEALYDEQINNWTDMRFEDRESDDIGSMAWCHGAPGIVLSRIYCYELVEDEKWKERFRRDIFRGYEKLKQFWKRDSWSLCHGRCGNLWILEEVENFFIRKGWVKETETQANQFKMMCLKEMIHMLPQERLNPGLMNGYGGILLYLLNLLKG